MAPAGRTLHGFPKKLSDLKTPVSQLQLQGLPSVPAQHQAARTVKQHANPALPVTPAPDRRRSGTLLGIPAASTAKPLTLPGQHGKRETATPLKSPAPVTDISGLLNGLCTPARHSRPPLHPAPCSSRFQQPTVPAQTPALVQPQVYTQYKSPMTMADLGLPARTGPVQQIPPTHAPTTKSAVIPLLGSLVPGQVAATSPEATPSRAQLLGNVPKQVLPIIARHCPYDPCFREFNVSLRQRCSACCLGCSV